MDFTSNQPEMLQKYDRNGDGKPSEAEIDTLNSDLTAKPEGKKGKRNKRR